MFETYANQTLVWKHRQGVRDDGMTLYADEKPIRARAEYHRTLVRDKNGDQVVSEALVMTKAGVTPGDVIVWDGREWPVQTVAVQYGLMGEEMHREVRL